MIIKFPTSPVLCDCTTLRSAKESYFNNVIYLSLWIISLLLNKTDYNSHDAAVNKLTL